MLSSYFATVMAGFHSDVLWLMHVNGVSRLGMLVGKDVDPVTALRRVTAYPQPFMTQ